LVLPSLPSISLGYEFASRRRRGFDDDFNALLAIHEVEKWAAETSFDRAPDIPAVEQVPRSEPLGQLDARVDKPVWKDQVDLGLSAGEIGDPNPDVSATRTGMFGRRWRSRKKRRCLMA
jgi:hypothetical protein